MTRLFAIMMALLIGAPNCWCCVLKKESSKPVLPECCKMSLASGETCPLDKDGPPPKHSSDDSCGCDLSKTKRDMGSPAVALPAPVCSAHEVVFEMLKMVAAVKVSDRPRLEDEGPPLNGCPLYVSHCALRP